jgi:hypothetical protein
MIVTTPGQYLSNENESRWHLDWMLGPDDGVEAVSRGSKRLLGHGAESGLRQRRSWAGCRAPPLGTFPQPRHKGGSPVQRPGENQQWRAYEVRIRWRPRMVQATVVVEVSSSGDRHD